VKFVCFKNWDELPESANALLGQAASRSVFLSRPWFECLAGATLKDAETLLLACVLVKDEVKAVLPLVESAGGNTLYSLKHGYTPLYRLLLADDGPEQVLSCLAQGLSQLPIKGLLLEPVAADDIRFGSLQDALETAGFTCERSFRQYNWVHRLQGQSYKEYMAERPARLRNTIARKRRKLERERGCEMRLFIGEDVPRAMSDYNLVYSASWKQSEVGNADFLNCFMAAFSQAGWTRLGILYVKGQPVAAQIWFVRHGKASIFRLVYDQAWSQYSPGSILTAFMMEQVIDTDRVEEIDFLVGNDAYKQDWMSERRERFVLGCKNVRAQQASAGTLFKRWRK